MAKKKNLGLSYFLDILLTVVQICGFLYIAIKYRGHSEVYSDDGGRIFAILILCASLYAAILFSINIILLRKDKSKKFRRVITYSLIVLFLIISGPFFVKACIQFWNSIPV